MARMFGCGYESIIGCTDVNLFPADTAEEIAAVERQVLTGQPDRCTFTRTIRGSKRIIDTTRAPVFDAAANVVGLCGVSRDITEEVNLREQMRQTQKMEAVGRLAGGVAHDFNNMLSVIIGHADMALEDVDPSLPLYETLKEIRKSGERSAGLTRQLLAFARKQTVSPKVLDLNKTVEGMTKMLQRLIGEDIDLAWMPGNEVWTVASMRFWPSATTAAGWTPRP